MKKTNWQYLVDTILFLSIVGLVVIGFLLGFVIPKGPAAGESAKYFLGLHRHQWGDMHLYLGVVFTAMTFLHLVLGWGWIKGKTRQIFGQKWKPVLIAAPVVALATLTLLWIYFLESPNIYENHGRQANTSAAHPAQLVDGEYPPGAERWERPAEEHARERNAEVQTDILITGQMSLYEVERQTGVSAQALARKLGIPSGVLLDERLGWLKRQYGFTMQQVREAVSGSMIRD